MIVLPQALMLPRGGGDGSSTPLAEALVAAPNGGSTSPSLLIPAGTLATDGDTLLVFVGWQAGGAAAARSLTIAGNQLLSNLTASTSAAMEVWAALQRTSSSTVHGVLWGQRSDGVRDDRYIATNATWTNNVTLAASGTGGAQVISMSVALVRKAP